MRVTRLGPTRPLLIAGRVGQTGGIPSGTSGGSAGQVLTATGSNSGTYWGENVARISANGSNNLIGPFVNFAAGSNTILTLDAGPGGSMPSNTIRIHSTGGGGGSLTVKDEGVALATDATTLDFVGAGVAASGTGATKTISVSAGSTTAEVSAAGRVYAYETWR